MSIIKFLINSVGLGVGLAMDAFSVSLANGLHEPSMKKKRVLLMAGVYAFFQFFMPLAGWVFVHTLLEIFKSFQKFIPFIALILLLFIGGKMVIEGLQERKEKKEASGDEEFSEAHVSRKGVIIQGIATSIDALSVGFTIAEYNVALAFAASLIIGLVTYVICIVGLLLGKKVGTRLSWGASILGGLILIAIGVSIVINR